MATYNVLMAHQLSESIYTEGRFDAAYVIKQLQCFDGDCKRGTIGTDAKIAIADKALCGRFVRASSYEYLVCEAVEIDTFNIEVVFGRLWRLLRSRGRGSRRKVHPLQIGVDHPREELAPTSIGVLDALLPCAPILEATIPEPETMSFKR